MPFSLIFLTLYLLAAIGLMTFGLQLYAMVAFYVRGRGQAQAETDRIEQVFQDRFTVDDWPPVVTQIPIYNEYNVAERVIRAVADMEYPAGRHTIQVLDDSDDDTRGVIDRVATELQQAGHQIQVIRRPDRTGYKAGALAFGIHQTDAEFFAIFDADFIPPAHFLVETMKVLLVRQDVGFVQGRWGHCNDTTSLLTRAQAIGIDGHFGIEQPARAWSGLFMNFNGTAGMWRRRCIHDAGGWEHDTLTEDMDLSYRAQLAGWHPYYVRDLVVPAELPEDINAFKSQQFRWAKGSVQTAIKLLPRVLRSDATLIAKVGAVLHMGHYFNHVFLVVLALLTLPVLLVIQASLTWQLYAGIIFLACLAMVAPPIMYAVSQFSIYDKPWRRLRILPYLTLIGIGIGVSNTRAVLQAVRGKESAFIRTPKSGDAAVKDYKISMPFVPIAELLLGIYCFGTLFYYVQSGRLLIGPFIFLYAAGFTTVGLLSLAQMGSVQVANKGLSWESVFRPGVKGTPGLGPE
jgi:cellulose synthase/poly-beta-1,6-N-acetylglucosamine synthase-like glycosyltransferase